MLDYYSIAKVASKSLNGHPGLLYLRETFKKRKRVLDVGCGEGSRMATLSTNFNECYGVDLNKTAVNLAKKIYPHLKFTMGNVENLEFEDESFDLVYSAFVIEHVVNYNKVISEMFRVCKKDGLIVILAPNYGAPNRRSPNSKENPIVKLIRGFVYDYFGNTETIKWTKVEPKKVYNRIDDDTSVEPYIGSLVRFFERTRYKIVKSSSLWELEQTSLNPRKILFKLLGKLKMYPFIYWGPQIFITIEKSQ